MGLILLLTVAAYTTKFDLYSYDGGIGLMLSCTSVRSFHIIEKITRKKIAENYEFGFIYDPAD